MDLQALSTIDTFTRTSLMLAAVICIVSVFVAWYTVRSRIRFSQVILGAFGYILYYVFETVISSLLSNTGSPALSAFSSALCTIVCIEATRYAITKYVLIPRFDSVDSAIGYALGFAGLYLVFSCTPFYFYYYSAVQEFLQTDAESFFAGLSDEEAQSAYALLQEISSHSGWEYILTAVNRLFYLVRNISLSVLVWYGMTNEKLRRVLIVAPLLHLIAIIPDAFYNAGILTNLNLDNILVCVLSGGIAFLAAKVYNHYEYQVAHFSLEKLRTKRHRFGI